MWDIKEFDCIKAVQHRAIRFFLGGHKKTANAAILGDMGWMPQKVLKHLSICCQIIRYSNMDEARYPRYFACYEMGSNF